MKRYIRSNTINDKYEVEFLVYQLNNFGREVDVIDTFVSSDYIPKVPGVDSVTEAKVAAISCAYDFSTTGRYADIKVFPLDESLMYDEDFVDWLYDNYMWEPGQVIYSTYDR